MPDITKQSLSELVENIKGKKLSSSEVTKAFVERSEKSKKLNAYITEDYANALNKAKKFDEKPNLDLKLPGIPMAVKDLFCTKDLRTTAGSKILNNFVPNILCYSRFIRGYKIIKNLTSSSCSYILCAK